MADYERAGQTLPENATNSEFSKCQVFDLRWTSTESVRECPRNSDAKKEFSKDIAPWRTEDFNYPSQILTY